MFKPYTFFFWFTIDVLFQEIVNQAKIFDW